MTYYDATITIRGVEFTEAWVSFDRAIEEAGRVIQSTVLHRLLTAAATFDMDRSAFDRFVAALTPPTHGASDAVLARRVTYGGRKGRSAGRRLRAKGFVAVARVGGLAMPVTQRELSGMALRNTFVEGRFVT